MKKSDIQPYVWQGRRIDAGIPIANRVAPIFRRIFEVTKPVIPGTNRMTVELGNGFYNEIGGVWNWQNVRFPALPAYFIQ